ncbi:TetR/AcrR family transcriptional regulator [Sinanaerobacter sp. ZZT-01]|uniref:TetR/AcrR family transcriptional regulator n=1 Tax=Sinanaerobacter sp. ZZT-01 TaxID=3111540 RepID=UPI002D76689A|nr:TetR/AcrR family transcriptional regulator [Sinanaerobacter sp. ZZT-01]WRR93474.1 TetR/AcrR family transcriptional regulator [Sinanaerobacter sp. ZZT-01]
MNVRKKQKREQILEATYDIFVEKGYANTKIIDIANRSGIGKGTVYEYFDSKEAIFMALFDYFSNEYKKNYEYIKKSNENKKASEQLRIFIKYDTSIVHYVCHTKKLPPHLFLLELFRDAKLSTLFEKFIEYRYHCLLNIIKNGISSGEFKEGDPSMYSIGILGSIAFYIDFQNQHFIPQVLKDISVKNWNSNDLLSLILNGLQK